MPEIGWLEVTREVKRRHPQTGVLILTMHEDDEQRFHAIRVKSQASATKDIEAEELTQEIRRVARGEYLINESLLCRPFVASRLLDQFHEVSSIDIGGQRVFSPSTPRDVELLDHVAHGHSNRPPTTRLLTSS